MKRTLLFALAAASLLALAAPANAGTVAGATYTERVAYGDLDLTTNAGADAMLNRIRHAAREVCGAFDNQIDPMSAIHFQRRCVRSRVAEAVHDLNQPMVSARYDGRAMTLASR